MAELIAGAFVTSLFERVFDLIQSGEVKLGGRRKKLDGGMRSRFKTMLLAVNAVLNDAENKQISDSDVRQWLNELKHTMYNTEDLVYELETEALLISKINEGGGRSPSVFHQVTNFFSSRLISGCCFSSGVNVGDVEDRIVTIFHTLEGIVNQKDLLPLRAHHNKPSSSSSSSSSSPQLLLPVEEESDVYGRENDKTAIVKLLLSDDDHVADGNKISVIPIVGLGGIGKTTLASLVYNDVYVKKHFDIKAWVTVSNEFDVLTLTKTLYQIISGVKDCGIKDPRELQDELKKVIEGNKFLFVLDDVWNEKYDLWDNLKSQFKFGASGSKIIVTTRSKEIGSMMGGNIPNHYIGILSEKDSWKLFAKHAFQNLKEKSVALDQDFEEIGRRIVGKCNGHPLALKSIGGLLSSKYQVIEWEAILNSDTWKLKLECDILPALWLSYHHLPPHLKRCFAYCSIFPKDYPFQKDNLILLWMAEDLLRPQQNKSLEEIGEEYFNDLMSRSFFDRKGDGWFNMHDLVNDLTTLVSGEFCSRLDDEDSDSKVFNTKTRHLSCMNLKIQNVKKLKEYISTNKVLHTLMFQNGWEPTVGDKLHLEVKLDTRGILVPYLKEMRYLRVLSLDNVSTSLDWIGTSRLIRYLNLSRTNIEELPDAIYTLCNLQTLLLCLCKHLRTLSSSIGNLKRLRYLDLSECRKIKNIPDTLCELHDLRTLKLFRCESLSGFPASLSRLVNLHYLDFSYTNVKKMPSQMCNLKHLQYLSHFLVSQNGGNIKELGDLQNLRGCLTIANIENIENVGDVWKANLKDKRHITQLQLEWRSERDSSQKANEVLKGLQPRTNVERLEISNYQGTRFPSWIGHRSYHHIVYLRLWLCRNCDMLPPVGQLPSLKELEIRGFAMVKRIGDEFYGCSNSSSTSAAASSVITPPFKSLETLYLHGLWKLREWKKWTMISGEGTRAFSKLKTIRLVDCPNIRVECLPCNFPPPTTLYISEGCDQLVASLQTHQLPWLDSLPDKLGLVSGIISNPRWIALQYPLTSYLRTS